MSMKSSVRLINWLQSCLTVWASNISNYSI